MKRISLKCTNCGEQDLQVSISIIPRGISISCNRCGRSTPLVVYSDDISTSSLLAINSTNSNALYNRSYEQNITYKDLYEAQSKDLESK